MAHKQQSAALRQHVLYLLRGGGAHADFDRAIADLPVKLRGRKPKGAAHSPWELLEHMRIAQWDILEFTRNPKHISPDFPEGCWPPTPDPPRPADWNKSAQSFRDDLKLMQKLVANPRADLLSPLKHGDGQTLLRETLLVA